MAAWFRENLGTILISLVLLAILTAIVVSMVRGRKKGGCGCGCAGCALHDSCHGGKNAK